MSGSIVIFGAAIRLGHRPSPTMRRRVAAALRCAGDDPTIIFMPTGAARNGHPPESAVMAELLRHAGVAAHRIVQEPTGRTTLGSVRACMRLAQTCGLSGPVRLASSGYHLPRCFVLARIEGLSARCCRPPREPSEWSPALWYWRLREVAALPADLALVLAQRAWRAITRSSRGDLK